MKKLFFMLIVLLLPFSALALEAEVSSAVVALGDAVQVTVTGAEGNLCSYRLLLGNKEVFSGESVPCHQGILHPRQEGNYTLIVSCGEEEADVSFTVSQKVHLSETGVALTEGSISVEGKQSTVFMQGDMRTLTVFAPGPWTAQTHDDFITLFDTCGRSGDRLTFSVKETEENRQGVIFIKSGADTLPLDIRQVARLQETVEEELSLTEETSHIFVEGHPFLMMELNGEETDVIVSASGEWNAVSADDFLSFTQTDEGLSLYADENDTPYARQGSIALSCGNEQAHIYVLQPPMVQGARVESVQLNMEEATAWQDTLLARVETSLDAEKLVLSMDGLEETYPAQAYALKADDMLLWQVDIPIRSAGEKTLLFAAEDQDGNSDQKQLASLSVKQEKAALVPGTAVLTSVGSRHSLSFVTTASAKNAVVLDGQGQEMASFSASDGKIAFAGEGAEKERYTQWTLEIGKDMQPAFLQVGDSREQVQMRTVLTPRDIALYSQTDGWWRDKKYSISELETSGCAVFSLAHALQLLGYTGEEITPEKLAKTYAVALMKDGSGTMNSSLVGRAGDDFGFRTRYELYENKNTIRDKAAEGAVFTFSVVNGHIACVAGISEDGEKCLIIDSAPSATFERKGDEPVYFLGTDGQYHTAATPADIPGTAYCIETNSYGCAVYYMEMDYVARRGVRLIQPR